MKKITILTPTFNRAYILPSLFESLNRQNKSNFVWVIVDDGSVDNTKEVINAFKPLAKFEIIYMYKENGGKHTAINLGLKNVDTKYVMIVDSDDYLIDNATSIIENYFSEFADDKDICGLSFLKGSTDVKYIGNKFKVNKFKSNHIECRYNKNVKGDKAEVFITDILKKYTFPEIEGEKFCPESLIWTRMARKYSMVYINEIIYICNYLDNGYTKSGKKLLMKSPEAMCLLYNESTDKAFSFKYRIKHSIQYNIYNFVKKVKIGEIVKQSNNKCLSVLTLPMGYLIYKCWKNKE